MTSLALAISPHLDDAAFSCGGTLATLAQSGWRVVIATVFAASVQDPRGFALACQLDKGLAADVDYMALRRDEDAAAATRLGAEPEWLPFAEAPHRGYGSAAALFGPPQERDDIVSSVADALSALLARHRPDLVLAPQAVGGHVDHVLTVHALDAAGPAVSVLWWSDFPYAARAMKPPRPFGARREAAPEVAFQLGDEALRRRRDACLAYESQLGFQFGGPAGLADRLAEAGRTERFRVQGRLPDGLPGLEAR